tara:strand:- start:829 stop:1041 length:213 start_codon:yes stop_codon:yes gene_type:complete
MGGVVSRPKPPPAPTPPPAAPVVTAPTKAEMLPTKTDMGNTRGRSSTILTGAKGLGDNKLTTSKKTLLGV